MVSLIGPFDTIYDFKERYETEITPMNIESLLKIVINQDHRSLSSIEFSYNYVYHNNKLEILIAFIIGILEHDVTINGRLFSDLLKPYYKRDTYRMIRNYGYDVLSETVREFAEEIYSNHEGVLEDALE